MLVMKSNYNVGPSLLYSRKRMSSVHQIKEKQHAVYGVRVVVPGTCVKKIQHRCFQGTKQKVSRKGGGVVVRGRWVG